MNMEKNYSLDELSVVAEQILSGVSSKILLFYGNMGSGKTTLIKELSRQLGVDELTNSPTFSLVNEYPIPDHTIFHIDLYRLDTARDHYSIGLDEILDSGEYVVVEWAEKILFPVKDPLKVSISVLENDAREILIDQGVEV